MHLSATIAFIFISAVTAHAPAQVGTPSYARAVPSPSPDYSWPPPASRPTLNLWPTTPPDAVPQTQPEADTSTAASDKIAGRPLVRLGHVTIPTLTLYQPASNPTGTSVVVFPGGGYSILAIDLEGTEVCQWLNAAGITCILAKYRVGETGPYPKSKAALDDAQRAVSLVRSHAAEWHLDPHRVGVLGFSAGGHLAAALSTHFDDRLYSTIDAADQLSCRPDFAVILYPGYLALPPTAHQNAPAQTTALPTDSPFSYSRNPDIIPTSQTPPTFVLQAEDDPVHVENATTYFLQLKAAHAPAELHVFAQGGHGYGLRPTALPITQWPGLVETWLTTIGMLPPPATETSQPK